MGCYACIIIYEPKNLFFFDQAGRLLSLQECTFRSFRLWLCEEQNQGRVLGYNAIQGNLICYLQCNAQYFGGTTNEISLSHT
jgi:hypothetical protein